MRLSTSLFALSAVALSAHALANSSDVDARAAATEARMNPAERTILTHGIWATKAVASQTPLPEDAIPGAGYVAGIPRLNVPALKETDAGLGVAYNLGVRNDGATALPSAMAMASSWNPALVQAGGAMIAAEARAKGFNVLLAGGSNLMRDPRNGRTFEYFSEDPLLTGYMAGAAITGIQSQHIISTIKHLALNGQETARHFGNVVITDAAARESDLLAFEIGIERGNPASVMCAYNQINGYYACDNDYLLNTVLKQDWGFKGFVMSDWGAVHGLQSAINGLDQQSGEQLDSKVFFGSELAATAASDPLYAARLKDMNHRILRAIYATGLDTHPPVIAPIDFTANGDVAQAVAEQGIVLLRNQNNALPLMASAKSVVVIGGYADSGVLSGGGSSQVQGEGGPAITIPGGGEGRASSWRSENYQRSIPLKALQTRAPQTSFTYRDGKYISDAVAAAKKADVAIVFATQWMTESADVPDLSLPRGQDALIAAVAAANPHTVVVLQNGGPVLMPWLDKTAAVVEAWYPGARGAEAITRVLYGDVNPSGRLPATFPASESQLPRPVIPGSDKNIPAFDRKEAVNQPLDIDYNIEGADIGYKWFARTHAKPLFPFGFGLSYTSFSRSGLKVDGKALTASFTVTNSGARAGADVAQVYLTDAAGQATQRLVGFQRVELAPGESKAISVKLDPRLLANWNGKSWTVKGGIYRFALGTSAVDLGTPVNATVAGATLKP